MATTAVTSSPDLSVNDPIFNQPESCYMAVDRDDHGNTIVSERYQYLDQGKKDSIVDLSDAGYDGVAQALADCGRYGSVHKRCKLKNAAKAHRQPWWVWFARYSGGQRNSVGGRPR